MESHGCVGERTGWFPKHLSYVENGRLVGAMPLYEKHNSWGEFVFDHAWAQAYYHAGLAYFPKLVNAVPFTPAMGQRILTHPDNKAPVISRLVKTFNYLADSQQYSGVHCLFPAAEDYDQMNQQGAITRNDCQFHWYNQGYGNFDAFLSTLKSKKRKNIRQERRKVSEADINIRRLDGHDATEKDWIDFTGLYHRIYHRKYGAPAFNHHYFIDIAKKIPSQVHLVLADDGTRNLAGALMYSDDTTLYGRHWGCDQYVDCLHFELCYYQGIEMCIENKWHRFDPGAQGEHKVARGFVPTSTRSLHWMANSPFYGSIKQFAAHEQAGVQRYIDTVIRHSPYQATRTPRSIHQ